MAEHYKGKEGLCEDANAQAHWVRRKPGTELVAVAAGSGAAMRKVGSDLVCLTHPLQPL